MSLASHTTRSLWFALAVLTVTVLAAGLRLWNLSTPSLWNDELFSVRDALELPEGMLSKSLAYLPTRVALELTGVDAAAVSPTGYARWRGAGIDEFRIRIGACLVGVATIPILMLAAAWAAGRRAAVGFGLLLALSTWHLEWSQNARFYAQVFLFFNLALFLYVAAVRRRSPVTLGLAVAAAMAAALCHATAMVILGVFLLDWMVARARGEKDGLALAGLALPLLGLTLLGALMAYDWWHAPAKFSNFLEREATHPLRVVADHLYKVGLPVVAMAAVGAWALRRRRTRTVTILVMGALTPLACLSVLAAMHHVTVRYTFVSLGGYLLLAGMGAGLLHRLIQPRLGVIAAVAPLVMLLLSLAVSDVVYYTGGYGYRARYRHAFAYVHEHRAADDAVVAINHAGAMYYLGDDRVASLFGQFKDLASLQTPTWFVVPTTAYESGAGRPHWLDGAAELRGVFATRAFFPQETLRVYYYQPGTATAHARNASRGGLP